MLKCLPTVFFLQMGVLHFAVNNVVLNML